MRFFRTRAPAGSFHGVQEAGYHGAGELAGPAVVAVVHVSVRLLPLMDAGSVCSRSLVCLSPLPPSFCRLIFFCTNVSGEYKNPTDLEIDSRMPGK